MSFATLQNNVRLRVFLILCVSIAIWLIRPMVSVSVYKATEWLRVNYILYGLVMVTTVTTEQIAFGFVIQILATILDLLWLTLGLIATVRCFEQSGCMSTLPASIIVMALVAGITLLDLLQSWSLYRMIRSPRAMVSSIQRVRILFAWALPFAWLNTILLMRENQWTIWVTPHIVIDPIIIAMAHIDEFALMLTVMVLVLLTDVFAFFWVSVSIVRYAIIVQIVLSVAGLVVLSMGRPVRKVKVDAKMDASPPKSAVKIRKRTLDF